MNRARVCPSCWKELTSYEAICSEHGLKAVLDRKGEVVANRYRLNHVIGIGALNTTVWDAFDLKRPRSTAVKICPPENPTELERIIHGTWIGSLLEHPLVTQTYEYGETDDGHFYCVMERLRGRTIHRLIEDGPLGMQEALSIMDRVLDALSHAHEENVVHLDVKPSNIFITSDGPGRWRTVLLDFGVARFIKRPEYQEDDEQTEMRRKIVGTPEYMAPEQILGGELDSAADIYAAGVVLFRMLTGKLPFTGETRHDLYRAHIGLSPPRLVEAYPTGVYPAALEEAVRSMMTKTASHRPSAVTLREIFAKIRASQPRRRGKRIPAHTYVPNATDTELLAAPKVG
ncbi:MAG: serine/threonine protein kinase [Myxococcota bacterium]